MRFAHSEGHTSICHDDTGKYLISCGNDGDVRIWDGLADDDDPVSHSLGACSNAIAFIKGRIYIPTDMNTVQSYAFPDATLCETVARFTSTVNHITGSADGHLLASGAGDFTLKLTDFRDNSQQILTGHQAPILSVAIHPQASHLASSSCDGSVKVWDTKDGQCLKTFSLLPKCNDFCVSKTLARIMWHPKDGKYLAIPVKQEVHIYLKDTWEKDRTLTHQVIIETITIVSFSPSGCYLAAACTDGKIVVWNFESGLLVKSNHEESKNRITDLSWKPNVENEISFADDQGNIGSFCLVGNPATEGSHYQENKSGELSALSEDDLENVKGSEEMGDSDQECSAKRPLPKKPQPIEEDEDSCAIDLGQLKASYDPQIFGSSPQAASEKTAEITEAAASRAPVVENLVQSNKQQEAFQPGSTPIHFRHRFMTWNSVGLVRCYNTEEENSVDVEFHDVSLHHAIHVHNQLGHHLAALSQEALLLACAAQEQQPSKVVCMCFNTLDSSKEWSKEMPKEENIQAIALGSSWAAVVTDRHFLRLFSLGGLQLTVVSLPGPVVCMAGGMENALLIASHQSAGLSQDQHLVLQRLRVETGGLFSGPPQPLPLSSRATLAWLGWTDEGSACTVDSTGVVRLNPLRAGLCLWTPVACLEERVKGKSDHYFVVGLSEIQQQIRCILCKGSRFPATLPRPSLSVVPFQLPFCQMTTEKAQLEDSVCRQSMLKSLLDHLLRADFQVEEEMESCSKTTIEHMMKLFAICVRSERESQALEVGYRLPNSRVVQGAIRYASQRNCLTLAQQLGQVAHRLLLAPQEAAGGTSPSNNFTEEEEEEEQVLPFQPRRRLDQNRAVIQPRALESKRSVDPFAKQKLSALKNSDLDGDPFCSLASEDGAGPNADVATVGQTSRGTLDAKKNPFKVSSQQKPASSGLDAVFQDSLDQRSVKLAPSQPTKDSNKFSEKPANGNMKKRKADSGPANQLPVTKKAKQPSKDVADTTTMKISRFMFDKRE